MTFVHSESREAGRSHLKHTLNKYACEYVRACVRSCVRACVRACVRMHARFSKVSHTGNLQFCSFHYDIQQLLVYANFSARNSQNKSQFYFAHMN